MPIIFLAVILKIPILYGMWLIYWAVKEEPELEDLPGTPTITASAASVADPLKPRGPRRGGLTAAPLRRSPTARRAAAPGLR